MYVCLIAQATAYLCPEQEPCPVDPCLNATCSPYPYAVCIPNNCNETCQPSFFHKHNLQKDITDKCNRTSCSEMKCSEKRVCVEEMVPLTCRHHKCEHHVRPRCVSKHIHTAPSDCSMVECPAETVCNVAYTRNGKLANCVNKKPTNCSELGPCDNGMICKVKHDSVAQCVAKHSKHPLDCSGVRCKKGFECALFGRRRTRPRCVKHMPGPDTCGELDCQALNMTCVQEKGVKAHCVYN